MAVTIRVELPQHLRTLAHVGHEVHLQETRHWVVRILEGPNRDRLAGLRHRLSFPASARGTADRRQQAVNRLGQKGGL